MNRAAAPQEMPLWGLRPRGLFPSFRDLGPQRLCSPFFFSTRSSSFSQALNLDWKPLHCGNGLRRGHQPDKSTCLWRRVKALLGPFPPFPFSHIESQSPLWNIDVAKRYVNADFGGKKRPTLQKEKEKKIYPLLALYLSFDPSQKRSCDAGW